MRAFLIVASFFPDLPDMPDSGRAGLWHAMPMVASGYAEIYALLEDGTFLWRESEMDGEARLRERSGNWSIEGDSLVLLVTTDLVWEGGTLEPATGSVGTDSELTGFTGMYYDYFLPVEVRLHASAPSFEQAGANPDLPVGMWRMIIGGEEYWLLSSDPGTIQLILNRD
ncbi:MAG TPA: hypothetical protein PLF04_08245 [Candidatus Fermentibacter daniensis]|nr:hypothetical protein [Candidatus Fermentibacter daniensis]HPN63063.1 hypothetical protein [Candidatus Fermentibacter daniensis]